MSKLHELLAVKPTRESETEVLMKDHAKKFAGDHHLFKKQMKVFKPATEQVGVETKDVVEEDTVLVTTVAKELAFVLEKFAHCVDLNFTIDVANTQAFETLEHDGVVFSNRVPATFLVHLEKKLNQVLTLVQAIATADPAAGFKPDYSMGENVLKADPITRPKTAKIEEFVTVAQATDKHPAQVQKVTKDVIQGHVTTTNWVSLPTVHQKAEMIARIVALKDAVVQARARANCYDVEQQKIFGRMMEYITAPLTK